MHKNLIIIGAGAHARVVLEAVQLQGIYTVKGFCADKIPVGTKVIGGYSIIADAMLSNLESDVSTSFIVAVGENNARELFFENALKKFTPATVIHPKASVSASSLIGIGAVVLSNACINSASVIGKNSIVNIGVLIDHDCIIGTNVHLSVGTIVGNNVQISDNYKTKIGEIIEPLSKTIKA